MRSDLRRVLDRQAAWQRSRSRETWAAKLRTSVIMRKALLAIRTPAAASPEAPRTVREEKN